MKTPMSTHLKEKRNELIFALSEPQQGYRNIDLSKMFNIDRSTILRILRTKPKNYKSKWVKRD